VAFPAELYWKVKINLIVQPFATTSCAPFINGALTKSIDFDLMLDQMYCFCPDPENSFVQCADAAVPPRPITWHGCQQPTSSSSSTEKWPLQNTSQ
jgi:hypothetical protein